MQHLQDASKYEPLCEGRAKKATPATTEQKENAAALRATDCALLASTVYFWHSASNVRAASEWCTMYNIYTP